MHANMGLCGLLLTCPAVINDVVVRAAKQALLSYSKAHLSKQHKQSICVTSCTQLQQPACIQFMLHDKGFQIRVSLRATVTQLTCCIDAGSVLLQK